MILSWNTFLEWVRELVQSGISMIHPPQLLWNGFSALVSSPAVNETQQEVNTARFLSKPNCTIYML